MSFLSALTLVLVVLKSFAIINISWWLVFTPVFVGCFSLIVLYLLIGGTAWAAAKS